MTQGDLFDVTKNFHNGADTSAAAFKTTTTESRAKLRDRIFIHIDHIGSFYNGVTCDEVERELSLSHQTASARITELVIEGRIRDTGERRKTRSGRTARVYKAVNR